MYQHIKVPSIGEKITVKKDFSLNVPANPIIPFIEGDGTGVDITPVMRKVVDAAVNTAYGAKRKIAWMEIFAGEKSCKVYGENVWLPEETRSAVASARSTSLCARNWTCMSACVRCVISRACPARSSNRKKPTW
jgi:isocitrate dehydrogenase